MMLAKDDPDMLVRTARKQHRCRTSEKWNGTPTPAACTGKILPGEMYVEYMGEAPPFGSGYRYCHACSIAAGLLNAE